MRPRARPPTRLAVPPPPLTRAADAAAATTRQMGDERRVYADMNAAALEHGFDLAAFIAEEIALDLEEEEEGEPRRLPEGEEDARAAPGARE